MNTRFEHYIANLQRFGIRPGLERIEALLARAENPHLKFPHLLVGGTNGKGSTCEFTARLLAQNGRKIGLYTSPHLYAWNERIRILPGEGLFEGAISDEQLDELFDFALPTIESIARDLGQPTEFEVVTFMGLLHFARQNVDAAVLEVGLGGKWDATNATDPLVSVVTHVALDHMDRLGNTLEEIAADKVCIARSGRRFLTGEWKPNVLAVFEAHCKKIGAQFHQADLSRDAPDLQLQNRQLAQGIAATFAQSLEWPYDRNAISGGQVPGRVEKIAESPTFYIDGANNPDGAENVRAWLQREKIALDVLVLGILADKNWAEMTQILAPLAQTVICTQSDSPRALDKNELATEAQKWNSRVEIAPNVVEATRRAQILAGASGTVLVTGSFTTIAEVPRSSPAM